MVIAAETNQHPGPVAKVGHLPTAAGATGKQPQHTRSETNECPGRAGTAVRDALDQTHGLASGRLVFGQPLELWTLLARYVVARGLTGSRCARIDDRFSVVLPLPQAGWGVTYDLGRLQVTVPAGCALLVERLHEPQGERIAPVALVEPYAWSLGDWAEYTTDETARRLSEEVLPALEAETMAAERKHPRPRFGTFADFVEWIWSHGAAALEGGA